MSSVRLFIVFFLLIVKTQAESQENEIPDTGGDEKGNKQINEEIVNKASNYSTNSDDDLDANIICPDEDIEGPPKGVSVPCKTNFDCRMFGELCCRQRCRKGVEQKVKHRRIVDRDCPTNPVSEVLPIRECQIDSDCWPRLCCPDGKKQFCRTPMPRWANAPPLAPLRAMMAYVQCTPPPPPIFDLFPKPCRSPIDCFPNLCCQEGNKKVCRPPKKSLLALVDIVSKMFGTGR